MFVCVIPVRFSPKKLCFFVSLDFAFYNLKKEKKEREGKKEREVLTTVFVN